jgi:hypothetical protein
MVHAQFGKSDLIEHACHPFVSAPPCLLQTIQALQKVTHHTLLARLEVPLRWMHVDYLLKQGIEVNVFDVNLMDFQIMLGKICEHYPDCRHLGSQREGFVVIDALLLLMSTCNNPVTTLNDFPIQVSLLLEDFIAGDD